MKRLFTVLILIIILSSLSFGSDDLSVFYNNQLISFESSPIILENSVLLPAIEISKLFGAQYTWDADAKLITIYRDNTFIKFSGSSYLSYVNGKSIMMDAATSIYNGILFVPIDFITNVFDINLEYDAINGVMRMTNNKRNIYKTYTDYFYKTVELPNFNINFDIPYYWEYLDEENRTFGYQSDYENVSMNVTLINNLENTTTDNYIKNLYFNFNLANPENNYFKISEKPYITSGFSGKLVVYQSKDIENKIINAHYITQADNIIYSFNFSFYKQDSEYILSTIENIINSFEIQSFAIEVADEHYVEYPKFINLKTSMKNEIYSNTQVKNSLNFSGTIDSSVKNLIAIVERNNESFTFNITVKDGYFDESIYFPFGLGKHNVSILLETDSNLAINTELVDLNSQSNLMMKFSVINISDDFIRYTIPDTNIDPNNLNLQSMAYLLTYKSLTDYAKSLDIYNYILENIKLKSENISQSSYDVYIYNEGNNLSITNFYVTLLRSLDIPSRVFRGSYFNNYHYWAEVYLNGSWYIVDPTFGILSAQKQDGKNYFIANRDDYYSNYSTVLEVTH
ncbi:MAG: hypothetical protein JW702_06505 [Clostridiales bacterium]|nr:hypothetical protein [Clostridiales bacterium]